MAQQVCLPFLFDDIAEPGSREFCVAEVQGFVVRKNGQLYAYQNRCPHTGVTLNWSADVFLDSQEELIQCAMHGALFTLEEGYCLHGPCAAQSLLKISLTVDAKGRIFVEIGR